MTSDEIIAVVKAYSDGKIIQCRNKGAEGWASFRAGDEIVWNFGIFDFRVAPEPRKPREWWAEVPSDGSVGQLFQNLSQNTKGYELVRVREVI